MALLSFFKKLYNWLTPGRWWYLMIISTSLHLVFVFVSQSHAGVDGEIYQRIAREIIEADSIKACGVFYRAFIPPLFCYYLASFYAIFGNIPELFYILNITLVFFTVILSRKYLAVFFEMKTVLWSLILYYNSVLIFKFTMYYKYELLAGLLVAGALVMVFAGNLKYKKTSYIIGGFLLGLAALATGRVLVVILGIFYFIWHISHKDYRKTFSSTVLVLAGIIFALSPWIVRNYICFDKFIPLTVNSGINFYTGFNENADGGYMHPQDFPEPYDRIHGTEFNTFITGGLEFIKKYPGRALLLMLKKINLLWRVHYFDTAFIYPFVYVGVFILTVFGPPVNRYKARTVQIIILGYSFFHAFFIARYYYLLPVLPLVYATAVACQKYSGYKLLTRAEKRHG